MYGTGEWTMNWKFYHEWTTIDGNVYILYAIVLHDKLSIQFILKPIFANVLIIKNKNISVAWRK